MKCKFKVGDHILASSILGSRKNQPAVVLKVDTKTTGNYQYWVQFDGCRTKAWAMGHELVEHGQKIVITTDGKVTTAKLYEDGKAVKTATAKCAPEDTFDFGVGAKLAVERLTAPEKPKEEPPKYYNGKVVCVKSDADFTVGKVYEIIDGVLHDDKGFKRPEPGNPNRRIESMDDVWINSCVYKFIPLVEDKNPDRPLTTEELMQMDGQKVWLSHVDNGVEDFNPSWLTGWHTVDAANKKLVDDIGQFYRFSEMSNCSGFKAYLRPQKK